MELQDYQDLANNFLTAVKNDLGDDWSQLSDEYKVKLGKATQLWAKLEFRALKGEIVLTDVERLQQEAQLQLWTGAGLAHVRKAFWQEAYKLSSALGEAASKFAQGALARALI